MRNALFISAVLIAIMAAFSWFGFAEIPVTAKIPTHWNVDGEIDGWSGRLFGLLFAPLLGVFLSLLFAIVPYIDPRKDHVEASRSLLYAGWSGTLLLLTATHAAIVLSASGHAPANLPAEVALYGIPAILILVGNFLAKTKSNFFLGVRTPWTLSSERAWRASNRAAGWMLVFTGIAAIISIFLVDKQASIVVIIAGVFSSIIVSTAISYFAWRNDPERASG